MATRSSTPSNLGCALLGLLARAPSTGYDLARRMERPVGYFWTARHSQIYPELARLEGAGLVMHTVVDGAGPLPTKRYAVTAEGLEALRSWVASDLEPQPVRDLETLRLWSIWTVAPEAARSLVAQGRARHLEALEAYRNELAEVSALPSARQRDHPLFASRLTLEGGVRGRQAAVEWCDWMLDELA
jgi:DNA-binding PadR family transcriptional regulator